jgi:hypothetical protein
MCLSVKYERSPEGIPSPVLCKQSTILGEKVSSKPWVVPVAASSAFSHLLALLMLLGEAYGEKTETIAVYSPFND